MRAWVLPPAKIEHAWPLVERWITDALHEGKADISPYDVKVALARGDMTLWVFFDATRAKGCVVTEMAESVRGKCCNIVACAGDDFQSWRHFINNIKGWAKLHGCSRLEAGGRDGWRRLVKADGWQQVRTVIEMRLDNGFE